MYLAAGAGPPNVRDMSDARGGQRMGVTTQKDSNKKASDLVGISPWFAPLRQPVCACATGRRLRCAVYGSRSDCGRILWREDGVKENLEGYASPLLHGKSAAPDVMTKGTRRYSPKS